MSSLFCDSIEQKLTKSLLPTKNKRKFSWNQQAFFQPFIRNPKTGLNFQKLLSFSSYSQKKCSKPRIKKPGWGSRWRWRPASPRRKPGCPRRSVRTRPRWCPWKRHRVPKLPPRRRADQRGPARTRTKRIWLESSTSAPGPWDSRWVVEEIVWNTRRLFNEQEILTGCLIWLDWFWFLLLDVFRIEKKVRLTVLSLRYQSSSKILRNQKN